MTHRISARIVFFLACILSCSLLFFSSTSTILAQESSDNQLIALTTDQKNIKKKDSLLQSSNAYERKRDEYENAIVQCEEGKPSIQCTVQSSINTATFHIITSTMGAKSEKAAAVFGPGLVPTIASFVDQMYQQKPAGFDRYLAYVLDSSKIVPNVSAQGIGFSALDPILEMWKVFRNIAYFLFVIIFIAIGFMVMFRKKISGQTVVTAQQAIPHIIIAMLFVTFSYAISGLLIDLMYVVLFFISGVFGSSSKILSTNIFQLGLKYFVIEGFDETNRIIKEIIDQVDLTGLFSGFAGLTAGAIVAISLLFGTVKLFLELLKSYVSIILLIIFSPFILMTGAIPGNNPFATWIKSLLGNLAAFPTVLLVLTISDQIHSIKLTTGGFSPPFLLGTNIGGGDALAGLVGIGMLLATTDIIKKVKSALGAKEGVFGEIAKAAQSQLKEGFPIAARGAGAIVGGATGGAIGLGKGAKAAYEGGFKLSAIPGGIGRGIKTGVKKGGTGGAKLSRMMGGNQPDYANWIVNAQDWLHGADNTEEAYLQNLERQWRRFNADERARLQQLGQIGPSTTPITPPRNRTKTK